MNPNPLLPIVLLAAALGLTACGGGGGEPSRARQPAQSTATSEGRVSAPGAKVEFRAPKEGSTVASTFTARVKLTNFTLDAKDVGKAARQGYGHLHFVLDKGKFDTPKYSGANGKLARKLGVVGSYSPAVAPRITYTRIPPGQHKLEVYLANNDHADTGVEAETEFAIK